MIQDELLAASLRQMYLTPLSQAADGGRAYRDTLKAFFATERNVSSAAAALGVKRHTVTSRLRRIEEILDCALPSYASQIEAAIRLNDLSA